jgi:hypothetical protein
VIFGNKTAAQISIVAIAGCGIVCAMLLRSEPARLPESPAREPALPSAAKPAATERFVAERISKVQTESLSAPPSQSGEERATSRTDLSLTTAEKALLLRDAYADLLSTLDLSESDSDRLVLLAAAAREVRLRRELQMEDAPRQFPEQDPKDINDAILGLLGYERFQKYESYESTFESRTQLRAFEAELTASGLGALSEAQHAGLLNMLIEERSLMPAVTTMRLDSAPPEQLEALASYYDRIEQRAGFELTPQQHAVFVLGVKRARERLNTLP